jgi:thiol-disulfide isomerase/thioredoxin
MVERAAILTGVVVVAWLVWRLLRARLLARTRSLSRWLDGYRPGRPAIVLFTTPDCGPCETVQRPALAEVTARLDGTLQILEIDALARPDLADAWGVLGAPTTFLIDARGRARRVNHGPVRAESLLAQLEEIDAFGTG